MKTATVTSKSGTEFTLTANSNGVSGKAKGITIGNMQIIESGKIQATFPQTINGKPVRIGAEFDDAEWSKVEALFDHAATELASVNEQEEKYDRDTARTMRAMDFETNSKGE